MSKMEIIDGRKLSNIINEKLRVKLIDMKRKPTLAIIKVDGNPASDIYVKKKMEKCKYVGINTILSNLENPHQDEIINMIIKFNRDDDVNGIIVQLPLPSNIDREYVLSRIDPRKDVDGLTPENRGNIMGKPHFFPCTPLGCIELLEAFLSSKKEKIRGKRAVVVGTSNLVGLPISLLLLREGCTVTMCNVNTLNLIKETKRAEILVVATGCRGLITQNHVSVDCIVIDIGITRVEDDGRKMIKGDVCDDVICRAKTPVPGGVGPMTVSMLLSNVVKTLSL